MVSQAILGAAVAAAVAVGIATTGPPRYGGPVRPAGLGPAGVGPAGVPPVGLGPGATAGADRGGLTRASGAVALLAGFSIWLLLGGHAGLVCGVAVALVLPWLIARLEPASVRAERLGLLRAGPLVADLLAASLVAGVPIERALPVVARALGGPTERLLLTVHHRMRLGVPADVAWSALADSPGLGGIARAVARSSRTGAPLAALLAAAAVDLRAEASAASMAEVRATSVRAVLPLGLCLLPAFALLGVVPVVGGLLPSL